MSIRGWVYVVTNEAMPGLVKVGFSTKDPSLRAKDFDSAALPYPYAVAYDILVFSPREVEQAVHRALKERGKHEQKEWFKCSVQDAIAAIRDVAAGQNSVETINVDLVEAAAARLEAIESSPPEYWDKIKVSCCVCRNSVEVTVPIGVQARCPRCDAVLTKTKKLKSFDGTAVWEGEAIGSGHRETPKRSLSYPLPEYDACSIARLKLLNRGVGVQKVFGKWEIRMRGKAPYFTDDQGLIALAGR